ncbi:MAG TPA: alpha/beta hydrolase, partial [Anaerolineae bacterium]|nr:alpha/beta hydrolase [Anaerolineae bacterium]
ESINHFEPTLRGLVARTRSLESHRSDHLNLAFEETGQGWPVVFVHGWGDSSAIWKETVADLSSDFRCIVLDLPGHGDSPAGQGPWSIKTLTAPVQILMGALGITAATIVGHSMGGVVALQLASEHPELVKRLVLVNVPTCGQWSRTFFTLLSTRLGSCLVGMAQAGARLLARFTPHLPGKDSPFLRWNESIAHTDTHVLYETLRDMSDRSCQPQLMRVQVPTLIIAGSKDIVVPPRMARRIAAGIPRARLASIPGASHTPMLERPAYFLRTLRDFLASRYRQSPASPWVSGYLPAR